MVGMREELPVVLATTEEQLLEELKKTVARANELAEQLGEQGYRVTARNHYVESRAVDHLFGFSYKVEQVRIVKV